MCPCEHWLVTGIIDQCKRHFGTNSFSADVKSIHFESFFFFFFFFLLSVNPFLEEQNVEEHCSHCPASCPCWYGKWSANWAHPSSASYTTKIEDSASLLWTF
jgi:hypothetical protein